MTLISRIAVASLLLLPGALTAQQPPATPDVAELLRRLDAQDKRIQALEAQLQQLQPAAPAAVATVTPPAPAKATPTPAVVTKPAGTVPMPPTNNSAALSVAAVTPAPSGSGNAVANIGPQGIILQSADGANVVRFRGNLAVDGRWYPDQQTPDSADTFLVRKARPYVDGTLNNIYDFRFQPDFGGGKTIILDAYVTGRFQTWFALQAGKFKAPVGLERLQPDQYNRFMELGLPSDLLPNRDLGVQFSGELRGGVVSYALGAFDGTLDGSSTESNPSPDADSNEGKKDLEGRVFLQPFARGTAAYLRGLGFGVAGTYADESGTPTQTLLPSYRTPGQQVFFSYRGGASPSYADGQRSRLVPQLYYYLGPFGLLGEYVQLKQAVARQVSPAQTRTGDLENSAWQVSLSYFLTGERETFNTFRPNTTFEPGKYGWGAWELALRYHELRLDEAAFTGGSNSFADPTKSARTARALGIGVNWYLNQNVRWMLNYERTHFDGGAATGDRPDENALLTRFQLAF